MSTMPGEQVDHVFAGGIGPETIHDKPQNSRPDDAGNFVMYQETRRENNPRKPWSTGMKCHIARHTRLQDERYVNQAGGD